MLPLVFYGPYLRFKNYFPFNQNYATWRGSVLFICHEIITKNKTQPPILHCSEYNRIQYDIHGKIIYQFKNWQFWKFELIIALFTYGKKITYWIDDDVDNGYKTDECFFHVPGAADKWRWAAYSCSGFSHDVNESEWMIGDDHPMVRHLLDLNLKEPLHAIIGGGDQIYNDAVFFEKHIKAWLEINNRKERFCHEFETEMINEAETYFFEHYCAHFNSKAIKEMFSCIPNVMLWDDHDIFDGWGSYPTDMLTCPVFQGIYEIAKKFYMLFQHHVTIEDVQKGESELFGAKLEGEMQSYSFLKSFGPNLMILGIDIRGERTKKQIIGKETWEEIFKKIEEMPSKVKHLVIISTVPIVYPRVPISEALFELMSHLNRIAALHAIFVKTGILSSIMKWDEPELLDDLVDHWTAEPHLKERSEIVEKLQIIAVEKNLRITFVSGDVHCAAVGRFYSDPKYDDLSYDPRFMANVITSAIVNAPPPKGAIRAMHISDKAKNKINKTTREKMVRVFKDKYPSSDKCLDRRNFLTAKDTGDEKGTICFTLWIENDDKSRIPQDFDIYVPVLKAPPQVRFVDLRKSERIAKMDKSDIVNNPYRENIDNWFNLIKAMAYSMEPQVPVIGLQKYGVEYEVEYDTHATVSSSPVTRK